MFHLFDLYSYIHTFIVNMFFYFTDHPQGLDFLFIRASAYMVKRELYILIA